MQSYTVEIRDGVTLVKGEIPVREVVELTARLGRKALADAHLARLAGATFAFGRQSALDALRNKMLAEITADKSSTCGLWQKIGEQGLSSMWLYRCLTYQQQEQERPGEGRTDLPEILRYPLDPSDLRRCRLMLEIEPQLQPFLKCAKGRSPVWDALIDNWDHLCALMDKETPLWRDGTGSCPKTYAAMKAIIGAA